MQVQLKTVVDNHNICEISSRLFNTLSLKENQKYVISAGHLSEELRFKKIAEGTDHFFLSQSLFKSLSIPSHITVNIWRKDRTIYLGPVVGIFVNPNILLDIRDGYKRIDVQNEVQANSKSKCLFYYYSVDDINWRDKTIKGFTYIHGPNEWEYRSFPFPNVIYDSGVGFTTDIKPIVSFIRDQFKRDPNTEVINAQEYLGKWQLYDQLKRHEQISDLFPETVPYSTTEQLQEMLNKHDIIYLKSYYGSRGKEVMSIEKTEKGYILYNYKIDTGNVIRLRTIDEVIETAHVFFANKPFIIQEGIDLLSFIGCKLDLRVLILKNGTGSWEVVYNQANLAEENATVTTIGGWVKNYQDIYNYFLRVNEDVILPTDEEIREKTLLVAKYIEKEFGSFGELGMDMAVDKHGKIWFIEANTKPAKNPIPHVEDTREIAPQCLLLFEYAKYLAENNVTVRGETVV